MAATRDGAPGDGAAGDDEANLAAVLAVLAMLRSGGATGNAGPLPAASPRLPTGRVAGRSGGEGLARWRAARLAVLRSPR